MTSDHPDDADIAVRGGAGGVAVGLDDLEAAARVLAGIAGELAELAGRLCVLAGEGLGAVSLAALLPDPLPAREVLRVAGRIEEVLLVAAGPRGAAGASGELAALALAVRAVVGLYRETEAVLASAGGVAQDAVMALAPVAIPSVLVGAAAAWAGGRSPGSVLDAGAFRAPWLADVAAGGVDGLLIRLSATSPMVGVVLAAAAAAAGRPFPPRSEEDAVATLARAAGLLRLLDDEGAIRVRAVRTAEVAQAPHTARDLVVAQEALAGPGDPGRVRVVQVPRGDGTSAWVVEIPGTRAWDPRPGPDPFDVTTDVWAMTGAATGAARGVRRALEQAQRSAGRFGRGDPVMLVGHSQGGILAASLASDPGLRTEQRITHVVTTGAPIALFPVPEEVSVLSLEHDQDIVPRLDGTTNPDRDTWVTVRRDVGADADVAGLTSRAHAVEEYAETAAAVDRAVASGDAPSLGAWARGASPFLDGGGDAVVRDYRIERITDRAAGAGVGPIDEDAGGRAPLESADGEATRPPSAPAWQDRLS